MTAEPMKFESERLDSLPDFLEKADTKQGDFDLAATEWDENPPIEGDLANLVNAEVEKGDENEE